MAVDQTQNTISYLGNNVTVAFAFPYKFFQTSDLEVIVSDPAGTEQVLVEGIGYTVAATNNDFSNGGTVTTTVAPTGPPGAQQKLTIRRNIAITHPIDYTAQSDIDRDELERFMDRVVLIQQQLSELLDRSLRIKKSDDLSINRELPIASQRAGKFAFFDNLGNLTAATLQSPGALVVTAFALTLLDDATALDHMRTLMAALSNVLRLDGAADADRSIRFASDATIDWTESADRFELAKALLLTASLTSSTLVRGQRVQADDYVRSTNAADLETASDPLPSRNCAVFDFNAQVGTEFLRDSHGGDLTNASNLAAFVTSPAKFGAAALRLQGSAARCNLGDNSGVGPFNFFGMPNNTAWKDVVSAAWVRFGNVSTNHAVIELGTSANNRIRVRKNLTSFVLEVHENSASATVVLTHSVVAVINTWHHVAVKWEQTPRRATLIVDGVVASGTVSTGPAASGTDWFHRYGESAAVLVEQFVDDGLVLLNGTIADAVLQSHFTKNVPWSPYANVRQDLALASAAGIIAAGVERAGGVDGASFVATPGISSAHSAGAPRFTQVTSRGGATPQLNAGTSTTGAIVDFGAFVPYGVKALLLHINLQAGTGAAIPPSGDAIAYADAGGDSLILDFSRMIARTAFSGLGATQTLRNGFPGWVRCSSIGLIRYAVTTNTQLSLQIRGYA